MIFPDLGDLLEAKLFWVPYTQFLSKYKGPCSNTVKSKGRQVPGGQPWADHESLGESAKVAQLDTLAPLPNTVQGRQTEEAPMRRKPSRRKGHPSPSTWAALAKT